MDILWGLGGIVAVLATAVAFSTDRRAINWRTVAAALVTLVAFAFLVLKWSVGRDVLDELTKGVNAIIDSSNAGIQFLFGPALPREGLVFAFQVLPVIVFFATLFAVLYHIGIMQVVVRVLGGALRWLFGIGPVEATSAAANIFVGQSEGFLAIRPYLDRLTRSEIFSVMTVGLATVAGSVLVGYALLGVPLPYLLAATFMTAPAGLLMAKMIVPEREAPAGGDGHEAGGEPAGSGAVAATRRAGQERPDAELAFGSADLEDRAANVFDAAARGALDGLRVAAGVGALLVAFISLIALLNVILGAAGDLVGLADLTFQQILGYAFAPVAFVIGVPWAEAADAGSFLGQKLILNEFVAFADFGPRAGEFSEKTVAVITFALCGFANFGSFAILLGALGELAPKRRPLVAKLGLRAILAGTLANLLNAAVAGMVVGI